MYVSPGHSSFSFTSCSRLLMMKMKMKNNLYTPWTKFREVYRNHSVCPSVCLSVQIRVRPISFFWFDIGLPYLAHMCITIRRCIAYIYDPGTTLNLDLKVKFILGFLTCFHVRPITFFGLTLVYHIWHMGVSPWDDVSRTFMIQIQPWTLTLRSNL